MSISFKEIILLYITIQGFISYVPQIVKIAKTKSSEDVSIASWLFWTINSALYLLYLLLDKVNIWLILSQLLEVILIGTTLVFVIIYKDNKSL